MELKQIRDEIFNKIYEKIKEIAQREEYKKYEGLEITGVRKEKEKKGEPEYFDIKIESN